MAPDGTPLTQAPPTGLGSADKNGVDKAALRAWRLERLRAELRRRDYAGILLYDPINVRYATDSRNMAVWCLHNAVRYCFVATEGPVVVFDFHNCEHLSEGIEVIDEIRPGTSWFYFEAGPRSAEQAGVWAAEIAELVIRHGGGNRRLAVDKCEPLGVAALQALGITIHDGQEVTELARVIKGPQELACMRASIAVCQEAMAQMRRQLTPGMTENQLWAVMNQVNAANGGEWIETRLLSAGGRTNPWFRECSDAVIEAGDIVSFDTDLIGPYGYCADLSRTFFCGDGRPSDDQRRLFGLAREQIQANTALLKPGLGFRELSEKAWNLPASCAANRYSVVVHGVGLCDEYPAVKYAADFARSGYDGVFEAGMTVCVESYMGEEGGHEGVKLEQQILITETGPELLSDFPFEEALLSREV
ncbi:aminopeptidase P family protein [Pelagibius litoralis]|uniref:Aminopeptidase P family protein n=1 Tax=Pelagibius litoralis TaxID=374515 RepID=A0A967KEZ5_9PROT|nr:Xaa-Pro peptidase family protein [Pelagibius litoralis]NIA71010.1 aminopeptidase P family protein [Pelagibius litoralis]